MFRIENITELVKLCVFPARREHNLATPQISGWMRLRGGPYRPRPQRPSLLHARPSPGILPPALAGAPESPELAPDPSVTPTCTFQYSFLHPVVVTGLCYLHRPVTTTLYSPRRPPQPSGRGCDVRDLRTNPGDSGDLSK
ncbi:hypothetical protein J6590_065595 [Homalodisca vitripennis]|nr:hypothetical protein J6590_065595 [Homalodisca vitripennis]